METSTSTSTASEYVTVYYGHNSTVTIPASDLAARFTNHPIHSAMGFTSRPATAHEITNR